MSKAKILLLDTETAPNTAYVWGLFKQTIGINQLTDSSYVMCWAAKWLGEEEAYFDSVKRSSSLDMLLNIHSMIEEADAVVHYNGTRFDMPILNKEFLLHGIPPPAPYKQMDLLRVARQRFRFTSNKLDYVAQALGVGEKTKHPGQQLWTDCMAGKAEAWKTMEEYNIQDVYLLEKVYDKFLPWIKNHINLSLYKAGICCPNCGSEHTQRRGYYYTSAGKYQRHQCQSCANWFRTGTTEAAKPANRATNIS